MNRSISDLFLHTRKVTERLCDDLEIEDYVVQSIPEVSPPKWHLAHTTWFFDRFILREWDSSISPQREHFDFLFNSYYETIGHYFDRSRRGTLSRPTVKEVYAYRLEVTERILKLLNSNDLKSIPSHLTYTLTLGIQHEIQHQELLMSDIKYNFWANPLRPKRFPHLESPAIEPTEHPLEWIEFKGGLTEIGSSGPDFTFDHESPRHVVFLQPYQLANRLVTCGEYLDFIEDRGYYRPELWLSDGWKVAMTHRWKAPLYWEYVDGKWSVMSLFGMRPMDEREPVSHLSYFEADAFARWRGKRLPTEQEWENAAQNIPVDGNLLEKGRFHPSSYYSEYRNKENLSQMYGDLWEWTLSPFSPYPGFVPTAGSLGEYNGKFMCNQYVLRGGSFATSCLQIRPSYRNFFPPESRWQFTGLRLASSL